MLKNDMRSVKFFSILGILFILFFVFLFLPQAVHAQFIGCAVTKVGNPTGPTPILPAGCAGNFPATGIIYPPNMVCGGGPDGQYCQMPPSTDGSYDFTLCSGTATGKRWGRKEMIGVLYTVAGRWHKKYPNGQLYIRDITAGNHKTHFWGIAVDIWATSNGTDMVANSGYNNTIPAPRYSAEKTVELGKLIADTGYFYQVLYNKADVNAEILKYARTSESAKRYTPHMSYVEGHYDHFHLDMGPPSFRLQYWAPNC
jgi:hypothetical protein